MEPIFASSALRTHLFSKSAPIFFGSREFGAISWQESCHMPVTVAEFAQVFA
jgi:hypothetical protein